MTSRHAVIRGSGHYLPERIVPNSEFAGFLDTSDEWIGTRTGIRQRHFAAAEETTSDMALAAAQAALDASGMNATDIDLIVLATSTPDLTFPSTATAIQGRLGMAHGYAFDIQAVCAGFVYALANAHALLTTGMARRALVIGAETFSRILDMSDRSTCVLFGDGAGAVVLEAREDDERGILAADLQSDGRFRDLLYVDGGVATTRSAGLVRMDGPELFRHAVSKIVETTKQVLAKADVGADEIDAVVPHQANIRIINATAKRLNIPQSRYVLTLDRHGNTSAASIPIALSEAMDEGRIQPGHLVLLNAIGGGLVWGSLLIRM